MHPRHVNCFLPPRLAAASVVAAVAILACCAAPTPAAPPAPVGRDLVTARLLADRSALRAGEPFTLGVLLEVQPGWHVYWQNPGDSGRPTRVKFSAPPGFVVGDLQYPVPEKFTQSDGAVAYGYTHSVLLAARVTPPADPKDLARAGGKAAFAADVSWLCCADVCLPGKARCQVELGTGGAGQPDVSANRALFAEWEKRVPVPLGDEGAPATGSPVVEPSAGGAVCSVYLHWRDLAAPPAHLEFFPAPEDALKVSDVSITPAAPAAGSKSGETRLRFRVEVLKGQKLVGRNLTTVIAFREAAGVWRGLRVDFPLGPLAER